jgi:hypothetical protein
MVVCVVALCSDVVGYIFKSFHGDDDSSDAM